MDAANLPPIIDGRHSLMLQEPWEGSVLANILAFLFCRLDSPINAPSWRPFPLIPRIEGFSVGQHPMSMVGALLSHSIPQTTIDKTGFVRHCQLQDLQSTDLMVPVGVKAPLLKHLQVGVQLCGRPMPVVLVLAALLLRRVVSLNMNISNNQAEYFALLQCLFRALRLQDPHVIFEVGSLILVKKLARDLPWACRSENLNCSPSTMCTCL